MSTELEVCGSVRKPIFLQVSFNFIITIDVMYNIKNIKKTITFFRIFFSPSGQSPARKRLFTKLSLKIILVETFSKVHIANLGEGDCIGCGTK